jgi:(E)-4-hydroxy-3-methylbut-2-enyl-diphosphate synthase
MPDDAAPGKVNLYVGKTAVKIQRPGSGSRHRLKDLIREHGNWVEPAPQTVLEAVSASPR